MLKLVEPDITHLPLALDYVREFKLHGQKVNGAAGLDYYVHDGNILQWFDKIKNHGEGFLSEGYVPCDTYFAFKEADEQKIIACVSIRHIFDEADIGDGASHIGYSVLPSEQRKGYGTEVLRLALDKSKGLGLKRVMLICDKSNIASKKTIEKCGGIFEGERFIKEGKIDLNYWINID